MKGRASLKPYAKRLKRPRCGKAGRRIFPSCWIRCLNCRNVSPALSDKIDATRIGVAGHSMGSYTAEAVGGALVDLPGRVRPVSRIRVPVPCCVFRRKAPDNLA